MAEAEDVITDVARHATVFVQDLWRRHRADQTPQALDLPALLQRLNLLLTAAFGSTYPLRIAQAPAPTPFVRRVFRRYEHPRTAVALPATDGVSIWLPKPALSISESDAMDDLRVMALQQAARAQRGTARAVAECENALVRSILEVLESNVADAEVCRRFGGITPAIERRRRTALALRPPTHEFDIARRALEAWVKATLATPPPREIVPVRANLNHARALARELVGDRETRIAVAGLLYRDSWTGELRQPPPPQSSVDEDRTADQTRDARTPRSARLPRRPEVREADERDERSGPGAWMVQTAQPNEHAEDPFGLQRPTDRDETTAAEEFADSMSELAEARLVTAPGSPLEVFISDDPPDANAKRSGTQAIEKAVLSYPEWDWRAEAYRDPGVSLHVLEALRGPQEWVQQTLEDHRAMLQTIRRHFEMLRARRTRLRQQTDGDDLDLDACIDAFADARAGVALPPGLYETIRNARRDMAVTLLIDVSGSTDGWVSTHRRVIDVEREALLLVCLALETLGEPYNVLAFSGEGPEYVTVRPIKSFDERWSDDIALRIAGLEPERYTRAGGAIRHATALLMREPATHRLLLLLSDGKPNDSDEYDGRYGVEDMRQSVTEARLQGIHSFCLTIDRQTANYLPAVFGEHQYAVLHRPESLPTALVGWLKRLLDG